ncbi:hypothetical protein N9F49_00895 [bacterium]|nr:hypothetical protein [bacterium]
MKWIGQHIWDFISRFRNKVYFENLEGGSSTTALVVDSEGRVFTNTLSPGSESVDGLSDVDTSTTAPSTNDVLKWDGSNWVPAFYNTSFVFSVKYNRISTPNYGTASSNKLLIGSGVFTNSIVHSITYNNAGTFTSAPTVVRSGSTPGGGTNGGYPLTTTSNGSVATSTRLNYPTTLPYGNSSYAYFKFTVNATFNGTTDTNGPFFNITFRNKKFYGVQAATSLTSAQIVALSSDWMAATDTAEDGYTQSSTSLAPSSQYVYYCYPSRISGTPVFKINGFGTTFVALGNVNVTNSAGYIETFKVWQSPQAYNGSLTLVVE